MRLWPAAKLPAGTVESLVKPENKAKLTRILLYHVAPGKLKAEDLAGKKSVPTAAGAEAKLAKDSHDRLTVAGAAVVAHSVATVAAERPCRQPPARARATLGLRSS